MVRTKIAVAGLNPAAYSFLFMVFYLSEMCPYTGTIELFSILDPEGFNPFLAIEKSAL